MDLKYRNVTIRSANLFVKRFEQVVDQHYHDPSFNLGQMAAAMGMSERQLQRKLQSLIGRTPSTYVRTVRLSTPPQAKITARRVKQIPMTKSLALFAANNPYLLLALGINGRGRSSR